MFQAYPVYFPRSKTNHFSKNSLSNLLNSDIRNQDTGIRFTCGYWALLLIGPLQLTDQGLYVCCLLAKSLQSCPTLCDPIDSSPPGSLSLGFSRQEHWSGCHFLLQCVKMKSESEVAQSCLTLSDPMDCSLPGSFIHGIFQARVLEWKLTSVYKYFHM